MGLSPRCRACCHLLRTGGSGPARVTQPPAAWIRSSRALLRSGEKRIKDKDKNTQPHFFLNITKDQVVIQGYTPAPSTPCLPCSSLCQIPQYCNSPKAWGLATPAQGFPQGHQQLCSRLWVRSGLDSHFSCCREARSIPRLA